MGKTKKCISLRLTVFLFIFFLMAMLPVKLFASMPEDYYINLLKSGKYQIVCDVQTYDSSVDKGNINNDSFRFLKNIDKRISLLQSETVKNNYEKPYVYSIYVDYKDNHYMGFRQDKVADSRKDIKIYPVGKGAYGNESFVAWYKADVKNRENSILKYLGPITEACGLINGYKVKMIKCGESTLNNEKAIYKEYLIGEGEQSKLRLYYVNDKLVRAVYIDTSRKNLSFVNGMKQDNQKTTSIKFYQFDNVLNYELFPRVLMEKIGR